MESVLRLFSGLDISLRTIPEDFEKDQCKVLVENDNT